ncbi:MAG: hypothetical protein U5K75_00265 [Ahrensia sp.]|nr:hypothetical protein [Ahrensia sp.]
MRKIGFASVGGRVTYAAMGREASWLGATGSGCAPHKSVFPPALPESDDLTFPRQQPAWLISGGKPNSNHQRPRTMLRVQCALHRNETNL